MRRTLIQSSLVLILIPLARADLLAPGSKWVKHSVLIDNVAELRDLALFVCILPEGRSFPIEADQPLRMSGNPIDTNLIVGIERKRLEELGGQPQPEWFKPPGPDDPHQGRFPGRNLPLENLELPEGVVLCAQELPLIRAINASDPTQHIITHLKLTLKPADAPDVKGAVRLTYAQVKEEREKGSGQPVPDESQEASNSLNPASPWLVAGIPAAAIACIVVYLLRRGQRPTTG